MKNLQEFKACMNRETPPSYLTAPLQALWYDGKGDWNKAHECVDQLNDSSSAHIHAYLHRKEGDVWNADYWYRRAKQSRPALSLEKEWEQLVITYLSI
jgi:hypothetical protein